MEKLSYVGLLFVCLLLCVWGEVTAEGVVSGKPIISKQTAVSEELINRGRELYNRQCIGCHGEKGYGDGVGAYLLKPHPRDFSLGEFKIVSTVNHIPSFDDLFNTISHGMPGTSMPPWSHFPENDLMALVHYVRQLAMDGKVSKIMAKSKKKTLEKAMVTAKRKLTPKEKIVLPEKIPLSMESIAHGRKLYVGRCAGCHGLTGKGDGMEDLRDNAGFPIDPRDFTGGVFKGGSGDDEIAYRIIAGMPATPMPSFAELNGEELWSLVYYVKSIANPVAQRLVEQKRKDVRVKRVANGADFTTDSAIWNQAEPSYLALLPLWWHDKAVKGVYVQLVHDGAKLAVRMVWEDATKDDNVLDQMAFSDGAAVQFSPSTEPPFFAMGYEHDPVNIWNWKAWREPEALKMTDVQTVQVNMPYDLYPDGRSPDENILFETSVAVANPVSLKTPASSVEDLNAGGFGSLTSQEEGSQNVNGKSEWKDGFWEVIFIRDLASKDNGDIIFTPGSEVSAAFAVWDGANGERNGQKAVTIWHKLIIYY